MILAFTLSMPGSPSWNGRWSGEDRLFVKLVSFVGAKRGAKAKTILDNGPYFYRWTDGWRACIDVEEVDAKRAAQLRRKSAGFNGYDWMVDTIITYGKPLATHELTTAERCVNT